MPKVTPGTNPAPAFSDHFETRGYCPAFLVNRGSGHFEPFTNVVVFEISSVNMSIIYYILTEKQRTILCMVMDETFDVI